MHVSYIGIRINEDDVPEVNLDSDGITSGEVITRMVYGKTMSMVYIKRPTGYRSQPHAHDSEQLNFVLEGEMWLFIEGEGAELLKPGDFSRVPELEAHWGVVEEGPCLRSSPTRRHTSATRTELEKTKSTLPVSSGRRKSPRQRQNRTISGPRNSTRRMKRKLWSPT